MRIDFSMITGIQGICMMPHTLTQGPELDVGEKYAIYAGSFCFPW